MYFASSFEENASDEDRYAYTSSSFSKVSFGQPSCLISSTKSPYDKINRFVEVVVERRTGHGMITTKLSKNGVLEVLKKTFMSLKARAGTSGI